MKKNGFVFIETVVAIVILTSSILLLYSTFNKILQSEKTRVDYDDISYIYRSYHIKNRFSKLNMVEVINKLKDDNNKYFLTIGTETEELFEGVSEEKDFVTNLLQDYDVNQIVLVKENKIDDLKKCNSDSSGECKLYNLSLSEDFRNYIKSVYVDISCTYVMLIEYYTCTNNTNCSRFYSWVSV